MILSRALENVKLIKIFFSTITEERKKRKRREKKEIDSWFKEGVAEKQDHGI